MPYPESLKELIKTVEKTRPERVAKKKAGEEVPFMSLEERHKILDFHPDFKEEGRREIKVGPSKGYRIAHEMVDVLEARSRVNPEDIDLSKPEQQPTRTYNTTSRLSLGEHDTCFGRLFNELL